MIGPLNHVGIAVPSIEDAVDTYKNLYGVTDISEPGEMIEQGVRYCFVNLPNSQIELIEPLGDNSPINNFLENLININSKLWNIEDDIRECERKKLFDQSFIDLARSVYFTNDERAKVKNDINKTFGSELVEVKSYEEY